MALKTSPLQTQSSLRSKSLDDREAAIATREKLLNSEAEEQVKRLEVLEKQIAVKEQRLEQLNKVIASGEQTIEKLKDQHQVEQNSAQEGLEALSKSVADKQAQLASVEAQCQAKNAELRELQAKIKERQGYLHEQEDAVNEAIASLNVRINEMNHEGTLIQEKNVKATQDLQKLTTAVDDKDAQLVQVSKKLEEVQGVYDNKLADMRETLGEINTDIAAKQNELDELTRKQGAQIQVLTTREKSIQVREAANMTKERELADREQRLNMRLGLLQENI